MSLVLSGRVRVGTEVVDDPDADLHVLWVESGGPREFQVDGRCWPYRERAVVMLNKPAGYECSLKPRHHPSVMSLLPSPLRLRGLQPVGRLDEDTTGLLLLTDDGELNHRLTSPKWHAPKVYRVQCRHPLDAQARASLVEGVVLDDDPQPVRALAAEQPAGEDAHVLRLTIGEGRYHQVKRMVAAVGNRVEALQRTHMGCLTLDPALAIGHWRWLSEPEEAALRTELGLSTPNQA